MSELCTLTVDSLENVIHLSGKLTFASVTDILEKTDSVFDSFSEINIDLTDVTRGDSAGLALLVHWLRQARNSDKKITFNNIPSNMVAIADVSGLKELLPI
ncbi:MAG: sulfate transporter [Gammaproteobacteria bacterium]|nr:MAG: sulfate transporter [Gammaproteobacteria bacterium]